MKPCQVCNKPCLSSVDSITPAVLKICLHMAGICTFEPELPPKEAHETMWDWDRHRDWCVPRGVCTCVGN